MDNDFICKCGEDNDAVLITIHNQPMCETCINKEIKRLRDALDDIKAVLSFPLSGMLGSTTEGCKQGLKIAHKALKGEGRYEKI